MAKTAWWRGERGEWYVVVQGLLFGLIALGPWLAPGEPAWPEPYATWASWLGIALMVLGAPMAIMGLLALGPALTALPFPTEKAELVQGGPYAVVRHPIYSGLLAGAFGWALYQNSLVTLVFAVALLVLFDLKSRREEHWLRERYPDYAEYQKRVHKLIPWIW